MPIGDREATSLSAWLGPLATGGETLVNDIHLDSRQVGRGDAFVALSGDGSRDARLFAPQAVAQGAVAVLLEAGGATPELRALGVPLVEIAGLRECIGGLAARFYGLDRCEIELIGVTGTNGKTTITRMLSGLMDALGTTCGVIGTLGWGFGDALEDTGMTTPDEVSVARILDHLARTGARYAAMEVSSHGLDQGRVAHVEFIAGAFTNLSRDHLDYHGNMSAYAATKRSFFERDMPLGVFNIDDEFGSRLFADPELCGRKLSYSLSNSGADVYCHSLEYSERGSRGVLVSPWGEGELRCPMLGEFNVLNALACVAVLGGLDFELPQILEQLPGLEGVPGRIEVIHSDGALVIIDYAHTPDALENVLRAVRLHAVGQLWVVFGCGGDRDRGKRPIMGEVAERLADRVVLTSDNPRSERAGTIIADILRGMRDGGRVLVEADRGAAIGQALVQAGAGDLVLIAGKGHEDYQEINGVRKPFNDSDCVSRFFGSRALGA